MFVPIQLHGHHVPWNTEPLDDTSLTLGLTWPPTNRQQQLFQRHGLREGMDVWQMVERSSV